MTSEVRSQITCPYCNHPLSEVSMRMFDGRDYHAACVESVSPQLYQLAKAGNPLQDIVEPSDASALKFIGRMVPAGLLFVFVVFGLPFALLPVPNKWQAVPGVILIFGGPMSACLCVVAFLGQGPVRRKLPRAIVLNDGEIIVTCDGQSHGFPLDQCTWHEGTTEYDSLCMWTGLRRSVVVHTPDRQFSCGHSPDSASHWASFLTLCRLPKVRVYGSLTLGAIAIGGAALGFLAGDWVGHLVDGIVGGKPWQPAMALIGGMNGLIFSVWYTQSPLQCKSKLDLPDVTRVLLGFLCFGALVGWISSGLTGLVLGGIGNLIVGFVALRVIQGRMTSHTARLEEKRRLSNQSVD